MTVKNKKRADEWLVEFKLAENRSKALAMIMAGQVYYCKLDDQDWRVVPKAGQMFSEGTKFEYRGNNAQDVGRGAQKLRAALATWNAIKIDHSVALDVGSSTGGFTQVLLEAGAAKVVALDVGTNQLHERLRRDPRVISLEQTHVLKVSDQLWDENGLGTSPCFDLIVTDVSFISLTKIIPTVAQWLKMGGHWILLIKPQFELEPKKTPGGVVKDSVYHEEAIARVKNQVDELSELRWNGLIPSPILGGDGNKEFLLWLTKIS